MKNFLRRSLCALLCLSLILCLCACDPDEPAASEPAGDQSSEMDAPYSLMDDVGFHDPIPFPDKNLEKALREAMKLPEEYEITPMHVSQLMYLDLRGKEIKNIDGLQFCASLEVLYLADNEIVHLDALEDLIDLFILDFSGNKVKDVTPILELSNLMFIDAYGNPLEDPGILEKAFDIDKTYVNIDTHPVSWE